MRKVLLCAVLAAMPSAAAAQSIDASVDVWLREAGADTTFENDLVSVWSASGNDGARRYGVLEFDLSSLAGSTLPAVRLDLYGHANSFSDDAKAVNQKAFRIDTTGGTIASAMTWNTYQAEYDATATELEGLGRLNIASPTPTDQFFGSQASASDLALIQGIVDSANPTLTLVLQMVEDGTDYAHSWSDGPDGFSGSDSRGGDAPDARLVIVPEPASLLFAAVACAAGVCTRRMRRT